MEKDTASLRKSLTAQKEKVTGREKKSKMRLGLSPEGCPKQDKEVFLKKSDKITFLKADFFTHIIFKKQVFLQCLSRKKLIFEKILL